jgi:hypothetical protein
MWTLWSDANGNVVRVDGCPGDPPPAVFVSELTFDEATNTALAKALGDTFNNGSSWTLKDGTLAQDGKPWPITSTSPGSEFAPLWSKALADLQTIVASPLIDLQSIRRLAEIQQMVLQRMVYTVKAIERKG